MKEKVVPFGMAPWRLFTNNSKRVDCSILISEGWRYHWEWPYGEEMWQDKMEMYEKDNLCVISCNLYSGVYDEKQDETHYFQNINEMRVILNKLINS